MCLFEGNGSILNFYSEVTKPSEFFRQTSFVMVMITFVALILGTLSYLTYADEIQNIILYNLPQDGFGVAVRLFYMVTILGIYVILIMPSF